MAPARSFYDTYARDLRAEDVQRLFTRDTREAYRYFARGYDAGALKHLPWYRRWPLRVWFFLVAFSLRLSPPRRAMFAISVILALAGLIRLFAGFRIVQAPLGTPFFSIALPGPSWVDGTLPLLLSILFAYLLILLEVADRLSLKGDLEVAREIQQAMLPHETFRLPTVTASGLSRPANTVGGDFYDILPLPDGRVVVALGDVAGKGSPASLLMALLLAVLRTLVDEGLAASALVERLNAQIWRHSPPSRFITLFFGVFDPASDTLTYVNAGQNPPLVRRAAGSYDRLESSGVALGMFDRSVYEARTTRIAPGELLILYSDGITEAEDPEGQPFDESGLERTIDASPHDDPAALGAAVLKAVERHARDTRLADDLTILILRRSL
ncbi:MAG: PP2C family protein-serine/threonine phosphatase [Vicinamibacterales bacterium]